MEEKRKFTRIVFSSPAQLSLGETSWAAEIVDLSLAGALLIEPENWEASAGANYQLTFQLSGSEVEIKMTVSLAHNTDGLLGLHCEHIDIDSATHLRRLVELNVGNDELLMRQLEELSRP